MVRIHENIPTQKALIARLKSDLRLKLSVGFLYSDPIPSEATYSRVMSILADNLSVLETMNDQLLQLIHNEFAIFEENVALDATAVDARTKPHKTSNPSLPKIKDQHAMSTEEIVECIPTYPSWGVKKNSQGKNTFWFGYKVSLAVSTRTQYILDMTVASAFTADVSLAIPTIRKVGKNKIRTDTPSYLTLDKGYDAKDIYTEAHNSGQEPITALKRQAKHNGEVDDHYAPTCFREHSYKYDSYDKRYGALKYVRPEAHCRECPLKNAGLCQKVYKVKQMDDARKYNHPARGTQAWQRIYNERSSVERVNAYLKDAYQLNATRFYKADHANAFYRLIQLAYNARTYANQRLAERKNRKEIAV